MCLAPPVAACPRSAQRPRTHPPLRAGWAAGLVVTITIASVEAWTLFVLARYAEQTRSSNYSELVGEREFMFVALGRGPPAVAECRAPSDVSAKPSRPGRPMPAAPPLAQVRKMLGPWVAGAMSLVMFAYIFGSCVAYLIIIGDVFTPLLEGALGAAWYTQRDVVIAAVSTTLVLPLCFPRSMSAIAGRLVAAQTVAAVWLHASLLVPA